MKTQTKSCIINIIFALSFVAAIVIYITTIMIEIEETAPQDRNLAMFFAIFTVFVLLSVLLALINLYLDLKRITFERPEPKKVVTIINWITFSLSTATMLVILYNAVLYYFFTGHIHTNFGVHIFIMVTINWVLYTIRYFVSRNGQMVKSGE